MAVRILPPLLALSLLSTRILPHRHLHPASYALYIDLLNRHAFSLSSNIHFPNYPKVMASIHYSLRFSQLYSSHDPHPGLVLVHLLFTLVSQLLEASLDDEGLLQHKPGWIARFPDSDVDNMLTDASPNHTKDTLHRKNTAMAIETISLFLHHKVTSRILSLVQRNMSAHWGPFVHQLQRLAANSSVLRSLKQVTPDSLLALNFNSVPGIKGLSSEWKSTPKL